MVKLYVWDASPPARATMMACELFNVPTEHIDVNLFQKDHLKPDFLKKNPLHTVPVLEDNDVIIHDRYCNALYKERSWPSGARVSRAVCEVKQPGPSNAILMYLADVYGKQDSIYPKDPKQRALVNQILFFNSSVLFPRMRVITYRLFQAGHKDIPQKCLDDIDEAYGFTEEFLSRTKYLAGDNLTIADIAAYPSMTSLLLVLDLNVQKYPKTYAWLKELEKLPWVQKYTKGNQMLKQLIDSKLA